MRFPFAIIATALVMAVPAFAQVTPQAAQTQPPSHHQPSTPSQSAKPSTDAPADAPALENALEKVDPAKEKAIRHLMEITQTSKLGDTIRGAISNQVENVMSRQIQADQLQKFMDTFNQKFDVSAPSSAITDAMIPVYSRHFTMEEIQAITQFYETPTGQHMVKEMPGVIQETHSLGLQMDQKAAIDVLRGMSTDYPQLKPMLPPDNTKPAETPAPAPGAAPVPAAPSGSAPSPAPGPSPSPAPQK
jgi:uncharacterized protein